MTRITDYRKQVRERRLSKAKAFRVVVERSNLNFVVKPQFQYYSSWYDFYNSKGKVVREICSRNTRADILASECREWLRKHKKATGCSSPIIEQEVQGKPKESLGDTKKKKDKTKCIICDKNVVMGTYKNVKKEIICVKCRENIEKEQYIEETDFFGGDNV
jgi:hypothetical protein